MTALAKRAVACKGWRWMPGMAWQDTTNAEGWHGRYGQQREFIDSDEYSADMAPDQPVPDLDDPATLGCLLALVREAWGPTCSVVHVLDGGGWALITSGGALGLPELGKGYPTRFHPTYAEGLVAALESAP